VLSSFGALLLQADKNPTAATTTKTLFNVFILFLRNFNVIGFGA
jgi:hypothetical protein